jgi:hypothetical protein
MNETSDVPVEPGKPEDYGGLCAELAQLVDEFEPVLTDLWPRLQDHKYRWELYSFGVPDGYGKLIASDIIAELTESIKGIGAGRSRLVHAHIKADGHDPENPDAT